jgi:hypothetical protein
MRTERHNHVTSLVFLIVVYVASTTPVLSGQVTYSDDSYGTGDVLTSSDLNAKFNEIKSAINDNDAKGNTGDGTNDLTVSADADWSVTPPSSLNFRDFTVNNGVTLTVPAGTTIRCTRSFANYGAIVVQTGARGGNGAQSDYAFNYRAFPHPGDSYGAAGNGGHDLNITGGDIQLWGLGGKGIPETAAASSYGQFRIGGGGGGAGVSGGEGGGLLKVYCKGGVINGTGAIIQANGTNGSTTSGGGGGGIIVLTSQTSIGNNGTLEVNGGNGGDSRTFAYGGGGGGGGIIILVSPNNMNAGTASVAGGTAGAQTELPNLTFGSGGGGGGACGGDGGIGGSNTNGTVNAPADGADGYVLSITSNPASMF